MPVENCGVVKPGDVLSTEAEVVALVDELAWSVMATWLSMLDVTTVVAVDDHPLGREAGVRQRESDLLFDGITRDHTVSLRPELPGFLQFHQLRDRVRRRRRVCR